MSYCASRQSKWVDLLRAASASAGPPAKRPPQRLTFVGVGSRRGSPPSVCGAGLAEQVGGDPAGWLAVPVVMTMMVSSPAMVPSTPARAAWSMAEAR